MSETGPDNEGSTPAKAEQTFQDEKAARREQRRSMQESGDYLGVQVPKPRTGYWDIRPPLTLVRSARGRREILMRKPGKLMNRRRSMKRRKRSISRSCAIL
jgi:hypothetical protein